MDFLSQYLKIKPTVANVLLNQPETRDDDLLLILKIWEIQSLGTITQYSEFKDMLLSGKLAIPATITRSRRKLQENNVQLRGKLYEKRKEQEKLMNSQIKLDLD